MQPYELDVSPEMDVASSQRLAFIRRTYAHLAGAIFAFVAIEAFLLQSVDPKDILAIFAKSPYSALLVFAGFMAASWIAQRWANSDASPGLQYAGLALYV